MATSSDPVTQVTEAMDKTTIRPEQQLPIHRLLSNPWAQPPLPSDWEVRPTHPIRNVPYYLAPLWDAAELQRAVESQLRGRKNSRTIRTRRHNGPLGSASPDEAAATVPKELRARLKHNRTAKGLLQDLEEEVRAFVRQWQESEARSRREEGVHEHDMPLTSDSEADDTVVFVGRGGAMHDAPPKRKQKDKYGSRWPDTLSKEKLVFEGADGDRGAGFARWLVHCVGSYYGLRTWSVTRQVEGTESRRQAYVGVDTRARALMASGLDGSRDVELPFPLWGMVHAALCPTQTSDYDFAQGKVFEAKRRRPGQERNKSWGKRDLEVRHSMQDRSGQMDD
ncbi:hypothetical protein DV737_g1665, partial [Chaetothyriales sp. CBS 132003]